MHKTIWRKLLLVERLESGSLSFEVMLYLQITPYSTSIKIFKTKISRQ